MDAEQLQAAYDTGFRSIKGPMTRLARDRMHAAGLAEVARQQAEKDAQIALFKADEFNVIDQNDLNGGGVRMSAAKEIAHAILNQSPEETG